MNREGAEEEISKKTLEIRDVVEDLLHLLGEDSTRPGLDKTPERVAEAASRTMPRPRL